MSSFIATLIETSSERSNIVDQEKDEKRQRFEEAKAKRLHEMMESLTAKYHKQIKDALEKAAYSGKREKYMNFERDDFKANFPTLGTPAEMASRWFCEMINEESKYLPIKSVTSLKQGDNELEKVEREHFKGLDFDIWNNAAFTVKLTW